MVPGLTSERNHDMTKGAKHLSDEQRLAIESGLKAGKSILAIAKEIGKHHSTVSREILKRRTEWRPELCGARSANFCRHRNTCQKTMVCGLAPKCTRLCARCSNYCDRKHCIDFEEEVCPKVENPPFTCHGCKRTHACRLRKFVYRHKDAHEGYRRTLVAERSGINLPPEEVSALNAVLVPAVNKGQSVYHVMTNNPSLFTRSEKTVYRYIRKGYLATKFHELPQAPYRKPRKDAGNAVEHKVDKQCQVGRTYDRFVEFRLRNPGCSVVEIDSVEGVAGGKVLTTMIFNDSGFMVAFLQPDKCAQRVTDTFGRLWEKLEAVKPGTFSELFGAILGDRGTEFSNPAAIEFAPDGNRRTSVFYCDAYTATQKPHVERNHEFIRRIVEKGRSFNGLTQRDVSLMMSHINSYRRENLGGKSSYGKFVALHGKEVADALEITEVKADDIVLKPELLDMNK